MEAEFQGIADPLVEVDARRGLHPTVIFFQARMSKFTIAVDAATGKIVGQSVKEVCVNTRDEKAVLAAAKLYGRNKRLREVK